MQPVVVNHRGSQCKWGRELQSWPSDGVSWLEAKPLPSPLQHLVRTFARGHPFL